MPLPTLIKSGFSLLLSDIIIENSDKALSTLKEHFSFRADEITRAYQDSYGYSITAITVGLAAPEQKLFFVQKYLHSKITRDFADPIEDDYFQPFLQQQTNQGEDLRQQLINDLNKFIKYKDQLFQLNQFAEQDLAALINYQGSLAITDTLLDEMRQFAPLDESLAAFLSHKDLLGKAILYFFHDIIRQDDRVAKTQAALQREGLIISVQNLETVIQTTQDNLNQAVAAQSTQLVEIAQKLQNLQAWQTRNEFLTEFSQQFPAWRDLLNHQVEQLLNGVEDVFEKLDEVHEDVIETQEDVKQTLYFVEEILQRLRLIEERQGISSQIKARDEFTVHNSTSLELIKQADTLLKQLPSENPEYSRISIMVGSALSSTGALEKAEQLFQQAIENSHNDKEIALANFNLFQVLVRRKIYASALEHLQAAIEINSQHALHNVKKYPMKQLLGVGGMGCVLLCENKDLLRKSEHELVVVKCFWESKKGEPEEVFGEALKMHKIAGDSVPNPLDYGYADESEQRAFFVTEYIESAIDGELWLEKYGRMDLETGSTVALQIANGLQLAHEAGIYHLDLKPANILLKKTKTTEVSVKIIDFGLSQVAASLREEAVVQQSRSSGLSSFGQEIFGTLDYAPPEQRGYIQYGKPSAQSDIFAFGKTMYRLLTAEIPIEIEKEELEHAPDWFELLSSCVRANPKKRPSSAQQLIKHLKVIEQTQKIKSDENAWQTAHQQNTKSAYQAYLNGNTLKKYANEAQKRLQAIIEKEELAKRRQAEEKPVKKISKKYSLRGVFIGVVLVFLLIIFIYTVIKVRMDENAWQTARQQNTKAAYQAYLYGNTIKKYANEAKAKLDKYFKPFRDRLADGSFGPKMVWIPAGSFRVGSGYSDENPVHEVSIRKFAMGQFEVTFAEYDKFAEATGREKPSDQGWGRGNRPVINVSWNDATAYTKWLSDQTGKQYRLPTEAEWEYAARAGTSTKYWWGNDIGKNRANCYGSDCGDNFKYTSPVGSFAPNQFGLYDTSGNVWEWTCSEYEYKYNEQEKQCVTNANRLSLRGGSWNNNPSRMRSAFRYGLSPTGRGDYYGFRVSRL